MQLYRSQRLYVAHSVTLLSRITAHVMNLFYFLIKICLPLNGLESIHFYQLIVCFPVRGPAYIALKCNFRNGTLATFYFSIRSHHKIFKQNSSDMNDDFNQTEHDSITDFYPSDRHPRHQYSAFPTFTGHTNYDYWHVFCSVSMVSEMLIMNY